MAAGCRLRGNAAPHIVHSVDEHAGFLTNYEVWRLVSSDRSERMHKKDPDSNLHNLRMIQSQVRGCSSLY